MTEKKPELSFTQRNGLEPIPTQLKLGVVSNEFRRLIDFYVGLEIDRVIRSGYNGAYFIGPWLRIAQNLHVEFFERSFATFENRPSNLRSDLATIVSSSTFGKLFNLVEFLLHQDGCSAQLKSDLGKAFTKARLAYRVIDWHVVAVGTDQQASAFEQAIRDASDARVGGARTHLISAGKLLRNSDWAGSVRESISAVEAMVLNLVPNAQALGPALSELERRGHIHKGLKKAFGALYGFSSDEEGIRHALVFSDEAKVDETDALFMLGACASFVSYVVVRASV
ncbi:hypothetical protein [Pseudooceanicola sp.]|uniref:hypothetical protein n=1 Tax=Pseudooceanicola sp. TaxID=1914328 RepID=UPI0040585AA9